MAKKILIIEDEPDILTYLIAVLEDHGFVPCALQASDGIAEAVKAAKPDVIILDVMMPHRSGVSIYKELRASAELKNTPVAIMSGFTPETGSMTNGFRQMIAEENIATPDGFIDKPIDLSTFVALVHKLAVGKKE